MQTPRGPSSNDTRSDTDHALVWPPVEDDYAAPPVGLQPGTRLSPETRAALDAVSPLAAGTRADVPFRPTYDVSRNDSPQPTRAAALEAPTAPYRPQLSSPHLRNSDVVILGLSAVVLAQ